MATPLPEPGVTVSWGGILNQAIETRHTAALAAAAGKADTNHTHDEYATDTDLAAHATDTTNIHGITDTAQLATTTQLAAKADTTAIIPKTLVDAKGDLIAATAADTVARLAVGADGQVLSADSTTATGLAWATPQAGGGGSGFVPRFGAMLVLPGGPTATLMPSMSASATGKGVTAVDSLWGLPMSVPQAFTASNPRITIGTAGAAGDRLRYGIWNCAANGFPSTLVWDSGPIAIDTTGVKGITATIPIPAGDYWLLHTCDGTTGRWNGWTYGTKAMAFGGSGDSYTVNGIRIGAAGAYDPGTALPADLTGGTQIAYMDQVASAIHINVNVGAA